MPYSEFLAARIRQTPKSRRGITEKKMFGGVRLRPLVDHDDTRKGKMNPVGLPARPDPEPIHAEVVLKTLADRQHPEPFFKCGRCPFGQMRRRQL